MVIELIIIISKDFIEIKEKNNKENIIQLFSNCQIKEIKKNKDNSSNILFIFDKEINDGVIDNDIILDEIFIMLKIDYVISNIYDPYLDKTCEFYNVPYIFLPISIN